MAFTRTESVPTYWAQDLTETEFIAEWKTVRVLYLLSKNSDNVQFPRGWLRCMVYSLYRIALPHPAVKADNSLGGDNYDCLHKRKRYGVCCSTALVSHVDPSSFMNILTVSLLNDTNAWNLGYSHLVGGHLYSQDAEIKPSIRREARRFCLCFSWTNSSFQNSFFCLPSITGRRRPGPNTEACSVHGKNLNLKKNGNCWILSCFALLCCFIFIDTVSSSWTQSRTLAFNFRSRPQWSWRSAGGFQKHPISLRNHPPAMGAEGSLRRTHHCL